MRRTDFHYELPQELIAQAPLPERSSSRLLCLDGSTGALADRQFADLPFLLQPGDLLLVFADALVRSWKQITKFRPAGAPEPQARVAAPVHPPTISEATSELPPLPSLEGLLRDERGIRLAPEVDD